LAVTDGVGSLYCRISYKGLEDYIYIPTGAIDQ
jgi:hypothetical protein